MIGPKTGRRHQILLVDDHPLVREGLTLVISSQTDLDVCDQAEGSSEAMESIRRAEPDAAVIDLSLREGNGLDLVRWVHARFPAVGILVLSAHDETLYAERVLRAGALGYLNKQESQGQVLTALRTVLGGNRYLSPAMTQRQIGRSLGENDPGDSPVATLSDRELQVFERIGQGQTTGAIARELHVSVHTIDTHRENIKRKLSLLNGAELTQRAVAWVLESR